MSLPTLVGAMPLREVRPRLAEALAPVESFDPAVIDSLTDMAEPPALILDWDDPWLVPLSMGDLWTANLALLCIASRIEPGPGIETLERLIAYAVARLRADPYPWPVVNSQAPRKYEISGITYLGARLIVAPKVTISEV